MRVTVDGNEVNMNPEDLPGFTYRIQDPIELGKFTGTKSTTFKINADNTGRLFLGGMAMAEVMPADPVLRIGLAGETYAELKVQKIEQDRDQVRLVAVGNNASWMKQFQTTKLPDLDLGRIEDTLPGDPNYDQFVVFDGSMNVPPTAIGTPYLLNGTSYDPTVNPLIGSRTWINEDSMLYLPIVDYGWDWSAQVSVYSPLAYLALVSPPNTDGGMRPGLRAASVLRRAFADLGYSLIATGRFAGMWKKLILPCSVSTPVVIFSDELKDINRWAPSITVMDLLKGIMGNRCVVVNTNDDTKTVTLAYYDDVFVPHEIRGKDFTERADHTTPPIKQFAQLPKHVNFTWQTDEDHDFKLLNSIYAPPGYGNLIHDVTGGVLDDVNVELVFAPTALITRPGGINPMVIPGMRPDVAGTKYDWKPRLLIADGITDAVVYRYNGATPTPGHTFAQPVVFFADPDHPELSLPFEEQDHITPGTVAQYWNTRLRRYGDPRSLKIDLRLFDDELVDLDFGTPIMVHDGHDPGWYYLLSINQKRFGLDEPTECELIPE